ncbi:hypothetical protein Tco_0595204 [Tanacetum coccineum]
MQFLIGLNDVFQPIKSSMLSRETLPDVNDVFAIVSREESHRGIASSSSGSMSKPRISGFVSKTNNWTNDGNKKMMKLMNLINDMPYGNMQANIAGYPNGTLAKIKYVGNLKLSENVMLFDVLVVPEYCVNLILNQFKFTIKIVTPDNGTEFVNNKMHNLFSSLGYLLMFLKANLFLSLYGFKPKLSHLRSFGCLYFSSILNNSDKFSAIFEKDVKFYETIFPFKMNYALQMINKFLKNLLIKAFIPYILFDEKQSNTQSSISRSDDGRGSETPNDDGNVLLEVVV